MTPIEIVNIGIEALGERPIQSFEDVSTAAVCARATFSATTAAVLERDQWNDATGRALLAEEVTAPPFGFPRQFILPGDCLRVRTLCGHYAAWSREGRRLLTDSSSPLRLLYTRNILLSPTGQPILEGADTGIGGLLAAVIGYRWAYGAATRIAGSENRQPAMHALYRQALIEAASAESAEGTIDPVALGGWVVSEMEGDYLAGTSFTYCTNPPPTNGGSSGVTSFNTRTGAVVPQAGDYTPEQVGADPAGTAEALLGSIPGVTAFNGRTGAVLPMPGDYTAAQVGADPAGTAAAMESLASIARNGSNAPTADIPWGSHKITALAGGTAATDAANIEQVRTPGATSYTFASGTPTAITITLTPAPSAYTLGLVVYILTTADSGAGATLNINGLGPKTILNAGGVPIRSKDWLTFDILHLIYDGVQFLWMNSNRPQLQGLFNVRTYGAVGNGIADDTAAIQRAIDAAEAIGGGQVVFPQGLYKTSAPITVQLSGIHLVGSGMTATIIRPSHATGDVFVFGPTIDTVGIRELSIWASVTRTAGADIKTTGVVNILDIQKVRIYKAFTAIQLEGAGVVHKITQFYIQECAGVAIQVGAAGPANFMQDVFISDGNISQCTVGIQILNASGVYVNAIDIVLSSQNAVMTFPGVNDGAIFCFFTAVLADSSTGHGWNIISNGGKVAGISCNNCWAAGNTLSGVFVNHTNVNGLTFNGGQIRNNGQHGIALNAGKNVLISNNQIFHNSLSASALYHGVVVAAGFTNFSIRGNTIGSGGFDLLSSAANLQGYGVLIVASAATAKFIIEGNILDGNVSGGISDGASTLNKYLAGNIV